MLQCARLLFKKKKKKSICVLLSPFTYPQFFCETEVGGEAYDRKRFTICNLFIILWNDSSNYHKRCLNYCISNIIE